EWRRGTCDAGFRVGGNGRIAFQLSVMLWLQRYLARMGRFLLPAGSTFLSLAAALTAAAGLQVQDLRTEHVVRPVGLDMSSPRLGWTLAAEQRNQRQTAYRVL